MKFTRTSTLTGITRTLDLNVSEVEVRAWVDGALIQRAMPNLNAEEREFIMTGVTPEEWAVTFPEVE